MKAEALARFAAIYGRGHTRASGAAALFNAFIGRPVETPVPLSLSHGVDFGHCRTPMDFGSIEPIHWCCNERVLARASAAKPAVLLPHPWVLLSGGEPVPTGAGTLVIGPPPGPANDRALRALLREYAIARATVLVKQVGNHRASADFWRESGFDVTGVAPKGGLLYASLFELLSRYAVVVGATFSSALVFAAALGRDVRLLPGYRYRSHFPRDYFSTVDFGAPEARDIVNTFCAAGAADKKAVADRLLGADLAVSPDAARQRLDAAVQQLDSGLHGLGRTPAWCRNALFRLAAALNLPALARLDRETIEKLIGRREVLDLEIDELGMWRSAGDPRHCSMRTTRYVPGRTEPGMAVEQYAPAAP